MAQTTLRVALDWTPNTNHTGFYVAHCQKLYEAEGLKVEFVLPQTAAAEGLTPARLVAAKKADFAVAPSESAISFATSEPDKPRLVAVAALLQGSTSCITTLKASGIDRPAKLAGKRYASYVGRFEDPIVRQMVANDGGDGSKVDCHALDAHGYADEAIEKEGSVVAAMLEKGLSDSTWIFHHWEGILAERTQPGLLNHFALEDYNIPYGYSPVLLAHPDMIKEQSDVLRKFLAATGAGYTFAASPENAKASTQALLEGSEQHESIRGKDAFVEESQRSICDKYLTPAGKWGGMDLERWDKFVDFLTENKIIRARDGTTVISKEDIAIAQLFSNEFL
eukprot:TRINITY_DN114014_c0_g1_i1.p1 TRINITY_DN114014_c0_g1~~TRINITY_DN114014_c0_g1_i1.p1  ORF type:complete len:337 (+),score=68.76 TRINITY_DN114014_c0_g1_i1:77-1087(+)